MKKYLPVLAALSVLTIAANSASARDYRAMRGDSGMRVSASFQTNVPVTAPMSIEEEAKATEAARKSLYQIASRECEIITQVFKGECRMININVRSYVQDRGNGLRQISVSVNASYLVRSEREESGDRKL